MDGGSLNVEQAAPCLCRHDDDDFLSVSYILLQVLKILIHSLAILILSFHSIPYFIPIYVNGRNEHYLVKLQYCLFANFIL